MEVKYLQSYGLGSGSHEPTDRSDRNDASPTRSTQRLVTGLNRRHTRQILRPKPVWGHVKRRRVRFNAVGRHRAVLT